MINLNFEDAVPNRGEDILNGLIEAYNQKGVEDRNRLAQNTMKFIEARIENVEGELNELEGDIENTVLQKVRSILASKAVFIYRMPVRTIKIYRIPD